jgi:hypothetical protein
MDSQTMEESWYISSNVEHFTSKLCLRNMLTNCCRHVAVWWLSLVQVTSNSDVCLLGCSSDYQQWRVSSGIRCCVVTGCLLTVLRKVEFLFLDAWNLDDEGTTSLWNIRKHSPSETSHLRRPESSTAWLWELKPHKVQVSCTLTLPTKGSWNAEVESL